MQFRNLGAILAVGAGLLLMSCEGIFGKEEEPVPISVIKKQFLSPLLIGYDFNTAPGGVFSDLSGNDIDLHATGVGLAQSLSKLGNAVEFLGTAATVANKPIPGIPGKIPIQFNHFAAQLKRKGAMSIQFWIQFTTVPTSTTYLLSNSIEFYLTTNGSKLTLSPHYPTEISFDKSFVKDTWYQVCITYDGLTAILYLDGVEAQRKSLISEIGYRDNEYQDFTVGSGYLTAKLDELRIYDTIRTATEVSDYYNSTKD